MSIQTKTRFSKRAGKDVTKYYPVVFDPNLNKHVWGHGHLKRKDAVQEEADLIRRIERQEQAPLKTKMTFDELVVEWLPSVKSVYAETTYNNYELYIRKYLKPVFGDVAVKKIYPIHVQRFANLMDEDYAPETRNKMVNLLSTILEFAIEPLHVISENPCSGIKRAKVPKKKVVTWTEAEISHFLSLPLVKESEYYDMFLLSFTTGMRPGEVCGIAESDVKDKCITLNQGLNKYNNTTDLKTTSSHRKVEISPFVYNRLRKRIKRNKMTRFALGTSAMDENSFLFITETGNCINPNVYSRAFRRLIERHNKEMEDYKAKFGKLPDGQLLLPQIRLYDCRHSFATNLLADEHVNVKVISEAMGHASPSTTLSKYAHVSRAMHREVVENYSEKLLGNSR